MSDKKKMYVFDKPVEDKKTKKWNIVIRDLTGKEVDTVSRPTEEAAKRYIEKKVKEQEENNKVAKLPETTRKDESGDEVESAQLVEYEDGEDDEDEKRRADWERNHEIIKSKLIEYIENNGRPPTTTKLAELSGYTRKIVREHFADMDLDGYKSSLRVLTPDVILSVARTAMAGNAASQKLWMQMMEGFSEKMEHAIEGRIELSAELKIQHEVKLQITKEVPVLFLILAKVALKAGLDPNVLMYRLQNSYYANYSGIGGKADIDKEEVTYPSQVVYNFDAIRKKHKESEDKEKEIVEEAEIVVDEKAAAAKRQLLAKLKKIKKI